MMNKLSTTFDNCSTTFDNICRNLSNFLAMQQNEYRKEEENMNKKEKVWKRKDGRWGGKYIYKGKTKFVYGKTKKETEEKLTQIKASITLGTWKEPCNIKLKDYMEFWLFEVKKKSLAEKTFESYEQLNRLYISPRLGNISLDKLTNIEIQQFINSVDLSPRTVRYIHTVLKMCLKHAFATNLIEKNVAEHISLPKKKKPSIKILGRNELNLFISGTKSLRHGVAYYMAVTTGMRKGEILALTWNDIDLEEGFIHVKKTLGRVKVFNGKETCFNDVIRDCKTENSRRYIPILPELKKRLIEHYTKEKIRLKSKGLEYGNDSFVFCNEYGNHITPRNFSKHFYNALAKAKVSRTNFHALRHTFATVLLEEGKDIKLISDLLGHYSSTFTADTYLHLAKDTKKKAVESLCYVFQI